MILEASFYLDCRGRVSQAQTEHPGVHDRRVLRRAVIEAVSKAMDPKPTHIGSSPTLLSSSPSWARTSTHHAITPFFACHYRRSQGLELCG